MKQNIIVALTATSILICSCGKNASDSKVEQLSTKIQESPAPESINNSDKDEYLADSNGIAHIPGHQDEKKKQPSTTQVVRTDWDKKIIKTASLNLEVKDYNGFYASLREKVKITRRIYCTGRTNAIRI